MRFLAPEWLAAVWVGPVVLFIALIGVVRSRALLRAFYGEELLDAMTPDRSGRRRVVKSLLAAISISLCGLALARPAWGEREEAITRAGRDVVFVVDVSRSMLAEDLAPNRLERAKIAILDVINALKGDRVGLVAFAGAAVVKSPLTLDYSFLRRAVEDLSPESVSRGGTLIGDAVRLALTSVFDEQSEGYRDLILITDGEDQESFPVEAAGLAGEQGVRIIAIGLGDEDQGRPIPITDEYGRRRFLEFEGERVLSRLDAETLRRMAEASEQGVYFNVATGNINLDDVYQGLIRESAKRELESTESRRAIERFQVFLLLALVLLIVEELIRGRR